MLPKYIIAVHVTSQDVWVGYGYAEPLTFTDRAEAQRKLEEIKASQHSEGAAFDDYHLVMI